MNYKLVETSNDINDVVMMASIIWPIAYKEILSVDQIKYMLKKYLSLDSITSNINDGYTYIILLDENDEKVGFIAYKLLEDKIFLSKLYILPKHQGKGYATKVIEYLKSFNLPIELTVNKNNKNAYDKYLHLGFKVIDSVVTDIGNNFVMDDYIMQYQIIKAA